LNNPIRGTDFIEGIKKHGQDQANQFMFASTGYVTSFDRASGAAKVMLEPSGIETGWLPIPTIYVGSGFGFIGDIDDQTECTVVFEGGNPNSGKIVCFHFQDDVPPTIGAGEAIFFHKSGSIMKFNANGSIAVTAAGGFDVNANMTVAGTITASGDVIGAGISLDSHVHGGVKSGGDKSSGPQ
jgi:phage baseplate assembly protein gpV